jgi:hypothetical protein
MGQISRKLASRFSNSSRYRKPFIEEAKRIRESTQIPKDVQSIDQLVNKGLDPLHAAYAAVQNVTSFFAEQVAQLDELEPYYQVVTSAEDEYIPGGPPLSPVTNSYFSMWALFDARFGPDLETIGACLLDTGADLGMNGGMLNVTRLLQNSRMGIYVSCGMDGSKILLRELLTDQVFLCHSASGYAGNEGELWYVRLCPPVIDQIDYHVAITTPYILLGAGKTDWIAYLSKQLLGAGDHKQALHDFLKHGPTLNHWNEFIFQAYHHHQHDAIYLAGLPDVKGSRPHGNLSRGK